MVNRHAQLSALHYFVRIGHVANRSRPVNGCIRMYQKKRQKLVAQRNLLEEISSSIQLIGQEYSSRYEGKLQKDEIISFQSRRVVWIVPPTGGCGESIVEFSCLSRLCHHVSNGIPPF